MPNSRSMRFAATIAVMFGAVVAGTVGVSSQGSAVEPSPSRTPIGPPVQLSGKPGFTPPPELEAMAWVLADGDTGEILAAQGPDVQHPMASTLKALTAYTVIPRLLPKSEYVARKKDEKAEGSHVGVIAGRRYAVHELLTGLMLPSGNDAASALANANGGWPKTLAEMNAEAERLGALSTRAKNPSGLDARGQVSTAKDLVTIFRAGLKQPEFLKLVGMKSANFPAQKAKQYRAGKTFKIYNQDRLLMTNYPGIIGGKTGYTTNAGRTFVGAASRGGTTLLFSFMRTNLGTEEAGRELLDWGFANASLLNPIGSLPDAKPIKDPPVRVAASSGDAGNSGATVAGAKERSAQTDGDQGSARYLTGADATAVSAPDELKLPWLNAAIAGFLAVLAALMAWRLLLLIRSRRS